MGNAETRPKGRHGCLWWLGRVIAGALALVLLVNLAGFIFETIASKSDMERYPPPGKRVDVGGYKLHLYCTGQRRDGVPTVVLEAGHGLGGAAWGLVQPQVAGFARVCSYDRAGYVWSDPGPLPRTSRQIAAELHALLSAAGEGGPYVLVGHSFGGHTVRLYADEHPSDVVGMVLVDVRLADVRDPVLKQEFEASGNLLSALMALGSRFGVPRLASKGLLSATGLARLPDYPIVLAMNVKHMGAADAESRVMAESDAQVRATGSLGDMPLIVLRHGVPGMWKSEQAERAFQQELAALASLSTNGQSIVAEQSGHLVMVDQPEAIVAAIRQVLQAPSP